MSDRELSPAVKARQALEKSVLRILWEETQAGGFTHVAVDNGEEPRKKVKTLNEMIDRVFETDESHVYFGNGNVRFWVYIVLGNDGYDAISDYSYDGLDTAWYRLMDRVNERTDKLEPKWEG